MALVEKLYLDVVTRANKAKEELESLRKAARKAQEPLTDEINKLKTRLQLRESYLKKTKEEQKQLRELLKIEGRRILNSREALKTQEKIAKLNDKIVAQNKEIENSKKITDARKDLEQEQKRQKILGEFNERRKAEQQDYADFVKRSSMESGRFSDRLDKRDRTRSLRENLRRGMEKGTAISERYHAEENSIYKLERSLGIASTAFDRVRHPAERLTDAFYTFQRIAYAAQAALGVLAGTIGDLVVGMMGLVGVAGAAAGSLIAVAGAMANLGAGMMTAKFALSGVGAAVQQLWSGQNQYNRALRDAKKAFRDLRFEAEDAALSEQEAAIALEKAREALARVQDLPADSRARREAELEFQRAELNYRRAKARVKDTNDALKKGPNAGVDRSQDPLNNLTKSQIAFAKYLVTLKPVIQELKEAAASSFLPPLQKSIDVVVKNVFPVLKAGLNDIGGALGDASRNFTDAFKNRENIELFRDFLTNSKPTLRILGAVAANAFGGILAILKAAQPITDRFARWIFTVSERFDQLGKGAGQDNLKKFFKLAGDVASELGKAFKLVFGGFKNIVEATFPNGANSGAGGVILQWLKEIGAGFKLFTGQEGFSTFLKNATENAKAALGTLGSFLNIFIELAANPANKEFWMVIQGAVPFVKKILEDGQKAGPAFGRLIVAVTELISRFSDSAALNSFFTTLQLLLNTLSNFVRAIAPILHAMGELHGVFLAIVTVGIMLRKTIQIIMGIMMKLLRVGGAASTAFQTFRSKLVAAQEMGAKGFTPTLNALREMRLEMTNLKRIELLTDIAKGNKKRQIDELRSKMALLNRTTKAGRKEFEDLKLEIAKVEGSYKRLKVELAASGKQAKTWGELTAKSAESARFGLDKVAASQERVARAGRFLRGGAGLAIGGGALASAVTSGTAGGGFGGALSTIGGAAMFAPNPIVMGLGAVASISGAIISGFDQANKEAAEAKEQKRIEIKAKIAEVTAEKVNQTKTAIAAFVGRDNDVATAATRIAILEKIATKQGAALGGEAALVNASDLVAAITSSDILGDAAFKQGGTQKLTDAALKLVDTGSFTLESAIAQIEKTFTDGRGGKTGLAAVDVLVRENQNTRTTFNEEGVPTATKVTPAQRALETRTAAANKLDAANLPLLDVLKDLNTKRSNTPFSQPEKYAAVVTEMQDTIKLIQTNNLKFGDLAKRTTDVTKYLGTVGLTPSNLLSGANSGAKLTTDSKFGSIYTPSSRLGLDPKTKIHFDNAEELQALNNQTLMQLLTEVKNNPKKTVIELKDSKGNLIGTYDIMNAVGSAGLG